MENMRKTSEESIASDIWIDCYDELSTTDNSIIESSQKAPVDELIRDRKKI